MSDKDKVLELSFENSRYFHFVCDQNLKIIRLEAENARLVDEFKEYREAARSEAEEVNELQTENKKLREALEFYANNEGSLWSDAGGAIAREALKEIE